jgi:hypothetical protein
MARTVAKKKLDSPTARRKLKSGRQAHWEELTAGLHLGYQRQKGADVGRWLLRKYLGGGNKYRVTPLGIADDANAAAGALSRDEAKALAEKEVGTSVGGKIVNITVRQAFDLYVAWKKSDGKSTADVESRGRAHILPALGDRRVNALTAQQLRDWKKEMADMPAQLRTKKGEKPQYRSKGNYATDAERDEAVRKRQSSANRVLTMLKAILNHAFREEQVNNTRMPGANG